MKSEIHTHLTKEQAIALLSLLARQYGDNDVLVIDKDTCEIMPVIFSIDTTINEAGNIVLALEVGEPE